MKQHRETMRTCILLNTLAACLPWCVVGFGLWVFSLLGASFVYFFYLHEERENIEDFEGC